MKNNPIITWPLVALSSVGGAFILLVLAVIPKSDTQSRSAVLGGLLTISTSIVTVYVRKKLGDVQGDVAEVDKKVNGRMTQLIEETTRSRDALQAALLELEAEKARWRHGHKAEVSYKRKKGKR